MQLLDAIRLPDLTVIILAVIVLSTTGPACSEAPPSPNQPVAGVTQDGGAIPNPPVSTAGGAPPAVPNECILSQAADWRFVQDEALDPFAARRPRVAGCSMTAVRPLPTDTSQVEIELASCRLRYASVSQATRCAGRAGDTVSFALHHLKLVGVSGETAEAYVALAVEGTVLWEARLPIPSEEMVHPVQLTLPTDLAAGATMVLHVDNHGENSYSFTPLTLRSQ